MKNSMFLWAVAATMTLIACSKENRESVIDIELISPAFSASIDVMMKSHMVYQIWKKTTQADSSQSEPRHII